MNVTPKQIRGQFDRAVRDGWLEYFQKAATKAGTTTAHLLAIGSRETNLRNIRGDYRSGRYHGYGVMQVDIGTDPEYAARWTPNKIEPSIRRGGEIYTSKVRDTIKTIGKKVSVRNKVFVGARGDTDDIRRIATAAYNCGRWAYYHFSRGEHVDSTTTGKDYSRDVYDRAVEFADLLDREGIEPGALKIEVRLQGKYARAAHRERAQVALNEKRLRLPAADARESEEVLSAADYGRDEIEIDEAIDRVQINTESSASMQAGASYPNADDEPESNSREAIQHKEPKRAETPDSDSSSINEKAAAPEIPIQTQPLDSFSPKNLPAFIPQFSWKDKMWGLVPAGFGFSTVGAYWAKMPDWLIFVLGVLTGVALYGFFQLFRTHKEKVLEFITECYKANADPQKNNLIPTPAPNNFVGERRELMTLALARKG